MSKKIPPQQKFQQIRKDLKDSLIERDDEIDMVLTALLCDEHPLLVGPPGTAKSYLLDNLLRWFEDDVTKFSQLIGAFTTPEDLFGPISVQGLKNDEYRRITTGMLPEARAAFIDEIFKAKSSILNTLLRILNERLFNNGNGSFTKVPLLICVAASNEWPNDQEGGKELGALFDRFLFRKSVKPISTSSGRRKLLWNKDHSPVLEGSISVAELQRSRETVEAMDWTDAAKRGYEEILEQLHKEGIRPGDRRQYKGVKAVQAYAYLNGELDEVQLEHLDILGHVLWDDPTEQPEKCAKICSKIASPMITIVNDLMLQANDVVEKSPTADAIEKLKEIKKSLEQLVDNPKKKPALRLITMMIKDCFNKLIGRQHGDLLDE